MGICKGICVSHKAKKKAGDLRYVIGHKFCIDCQIFMKWEGIYCPCCGIKLRTKPRRSRSKHLYRKSVEVRRN